MLAVYILYMEHTKPLLPLKILVFCSLSAYTHPCGIYDQSLLCKLFEIVDLVMTLMLRFSVVLWLVHHCDNDTRQFFCCSDHRLNQFCRHVIVQ